MAQAPLFAVFMIALFLYILIKASNGVGSRSNFSVKYDLRSAAGDLGLSFSPDTFSTRFRVEGDYRGRQVRMFTKYGAIKGIPTTRVADLFTFSISYEPTVDIDITISKAGPVMSLLKKWQLRPLSRAEEDLGIKLSVSGTDMDQLTGFIDDGLLTLIYEDMAELHINRQWIHYVISAYTVGDNEKRRRVNLLMSLAERLETEANLLLMH